MTVVPFTTADDVRAALPRATAHLRRGGLLAYPTETVYGLGSRPIDADVASLARLKGRQEGKPFLLLVASREMAAAYGLMFTAAARALADRFWPGPLTLVLPGGEGRLPPSLRGPEGGIAVRLTSHPDIRALISALDTPITSTSANRPGEPTAPDAATIVGAFLGAVEAGTLLVLDGGRLGRAPSSTLVDCTAEPPRLVREGAVRRDALATTTPDLAS